MNDATHAQHDAVKQTMLGRGPRVGSPILVRNSSAKTSSIPVVVEGVVFSPRRLINIGELFFQNSQSLEIIGDLYQDTEAFCHYS